MNEIKKILREQERSQGWLSMKTGFDRIYINKLANNKIQDPHLSKAIKISKALGRSIPEIWKF